MSNHIGVEHQADFQWTFIFLWPWEWLSIITPPRSLGYGSSAWDCLKKISRCENFSFVDVSKLWVLPKISWRWFIWVVNFYELSSKPPKQMWSFGRNDFKLKSQSWPSCFLRDGTAKKMASHWEMYVSSPHTVSIWVYKTWIDYSDRTSYYQILSHVATILFWWCLWFLSFGFNIVSFSPCQKRGRWFSFPIFTKLCVFPKIHKAIVLIPPRVLSLIFWGSNTANLWHIWGISLIIMPCLGWSYNDPCLLLRLCEFPQCQWCWARPGHPELLEHQGSWGFEKQTPIQKAGILGSLKSIFNRKKQINKSLIYIYICI